MTRGLLIGFVMEARISASLTASPMRSGRAVFLVLCSVVRNPADEPDATYRVWNPPSFTQCQRQNTDDVGDVC